MLAAFATEGAVASQDVSGNPGEPAQAGAWRFGAALLDEQLAELRVAGVRVDLDRSSYDVLLALLRHAGEVVTKDELLEAGWPGRVVSENSLAKAVSRLRQALGADAETLRSVHGYGYRLAAAVNFQPLPDGRTPAQALDPAHLHPGDPLPHRPGWRLERRLGQGSAGVIYLARSPGGEERAVKVAGNEPGLRSLKREIALTRYIRAVKPELASVAPVLGWNLSQPPFFLERPYFAHGDLAEWAAARGGLGSLALDARLALCADLCEAVAELHGIGIIHKDLKPENLFPVEEAPDEGAGWRLVLADLGAGEAAQPPRLLELGITMSIAIGETSQQAGSALYMAPEVIAGELPTQRSDVFALGVLLYQLVVGNLRRSLAPGWENDVDDPLLREDIALAAAANPERRQIDARALGERLRTLEARHAARAARQEREAEEARRNAERVRDRNRLRIGGMLAAVLCVGLVASLFLYSRAETERRAAEEQAQQRQAVLDFVTRDILGQADPYAKAGGAGISLREAVERASAHVDTRLRHDPSAAAAVHAMVGAVAFAQDRHDTAIAEYQRARDLYASAGKANAAARVRVETGLCDVQRIASRLERAEEACASAVRLAKESGAEVDFATLKLGQLRTEQGRYEEAQRILQPLLDRDVFARDDNAQGELRWSLGLCARNLGHFAVARRHFEALLALYRKAGADSTWTAWAHNSLGSVMFETGDYAQAETTLLAARRIFAETQGAGQVEAQMPNIWRAEIRLQRGEWREAAGMEQALLAAWSALAPDHPLRQKALASLAWAQAEAGERAAARTLLDAAWRDRARVFERRGDHIATRTLRWTRAALALGDNTQAGALLRIATAAVAREVPESHPLRAELSCTRARWLLATGDAPAAADAAEGCVRMLLRFHPRTHPLVREARSLLATAGARPAGT
jgi:non-specific serine/threonine protein kinase